MILLPLKLELFHCTNHQIFGETFHHYQLHHDLLFDWSSSLNMWVCSVTFSWSVDLGSWAGQPGTNWIRKPFWTNLLWAANLVKRIPFFLCKVPYKKYRTMTIFRFLNIQIVLAFKTVYLCFCIVTMLHRHIILNKWNATDWSTFQLVKCSTGQRFD